MLPLRFYGLLWLFVAFALNGLGQDISSNPQHATMFQNGVKEELAGNYKEALKIYRQLTNLEPNNDNVLYQQASVAYRLGLLDEARDILEKIVAADVKKEEAYTLLASILTREGKTKESLRVISKGLAVFPQSGLLFYTKGQRYESEHDAAHALEAYADGIAQAPKFAGNYKAASQLAQHTPNALWGLLWGETYLLLQPNQTYLQSFRDTLVQAWQDYYDDLQHSDNCNDCTTFERTFRTETLKTTPITSAGFNRSTLAAARMQFAAQWAQNYAHELPFPLFELHSRLAKSDFADTYWQWLFSDNKTTLTEASVRDMRTWINANLPTLSYPHSYLKIKKLKYR